MVLCLKKVQRDVVTDEYNFKFTEVLVEPSRNDNFSSLSPVWFIFYFGNKSVLFHIGLFK